MTGSCLKDSYFAVWNFNSGKIWTFSTWWDTKKLTLKAMEPNSYRDKCFWSRASDSVCTESGSEHCHFTKEGLASKILQDSGEAGSQNSHIPRGLHLLMTSWKTIIFVCLFF